jgi:hypothetical protein
MASGLVAVRGWLYDYQSLNATTAIYDANIFEVAHKHI